GDQVRDAGQGGSQSRRQRDEVSRETDEIQKVDEGRGEGDERRRRVRRQGIAQDGDGSGDDRGTSAEDHPAGKSIADDGGQHGPDERDGEVQGRHLLARGNASRRLFAPRRRRRVAQVLTTTNVISPPARLTVTTIALEAGVLLPAATWSCGTRTFASGK